MDIEDRMAWIAQGYKQQKPPKTNQSKKDEIPKNILRLRVY